MLRLRIDGLPPQARGLYYLVEDGSVVPLSKGHQVLVTMKEDGSVAIERYFNGRQDETWAPVTPFEAGIALTAIVNGYQPPRCPRRQDKLFDEIQPGSGSAPAA